MPKRVKNIKKGKKDEKSNVSKEPESFENREDYRETVEWLEEENATCADCLNRGPSWASLDLGIFLCSSCQQSHRDYKISKEIVNLTHLNLDQHKTMHMSMGNAEAARYWEAKQPSVEERLVPDTFIRKKYIEKRWVSKGHEENDAEVTIKITPDQDASKKKKKEKKKKKKKEKKLEKAIQLSETGANLSLSSSFAPPEESSPPLADQSPGEKGISSSGQGSGRSEEVLAPLPVEREVSYDDPLYRARAAAMGHPSLEPNSMVALGATSTACPPFVKIKQDAAGQNKWLLVNLESRKMEVVSDMLNRATWNDKVVAQLIRTKFIFWQVYEDTTEGRQVCTYYNLVSLPVVLLLDPITGKKMHLWSGMIRPRPLLKVLLPIVDEGPKDHLEPKGADSCSMEFPRCPIETYLLTMAGQEVKEKFRTCNEEELQEKMRTHVLEVSRRLMQARVGARLQQLNDYKLWLLSEGMDDDEIKYISGDMTSTILQMDKKANVITLTGLEIFPKVGELGGETIVGNLEVHTNGFSYATSSPSFHFHFMCADIRRTFFRVGDEKMPPLLHFNLHNPVKVGAEVRQDIQFRLVQTPVGQRTSYNDLEKQTRDGEDLKNFVKKVQRKWSTYTFDVAEVFKRAEFQGNLPSKVPTVFGLTFYALVGLVDEPFIVAYLNKIEIVCLRLKPAVIDMTIIFKDFKRDLVHINSIPIAALGLIKDSFNFAMVKYYQIYKDLDWDSMVKGIADSPNEFITNGGWLNYQLEDDATAKFYDYFYEKVEVKERKLDDEGEEIGPYGSDDELEDEG